MSSRILVLGGTAEARWLALALAIAGKPVTTSLAGRVARPRLPPGDVRIGGFGGPRAFADWIAEYGVVAVVDATHPFAERISASAAEACRLAGVPLLRLQRPGWTEREGDRWHWVGDVDEAAAAIVSLGCRVL
ncbi:MAG: precorrin-6A/cobalt-precorrin-6A reductase, partial [Actinobacteria bacterium]|nr:precorrin-6A/cobalt-precorrin-6A reductase [Actinomycetota bacterium]